MFWICFLKSGSYYIAQTSPELKLFLPQPPVLGLRGVLPSSDNTQMHGWLLIPLPCILPVHKQDLHISAQLREYWNHGFSIHIRDYPSSFSWKILLPSPSLCWCFSYPQILVHCNEHSQECSYSTIMLHFTWSTHSYNTCPSTQQYKVVAQEIFGWWINRHWNISSSVAPHQNLPSFVSPFPGLEISTHLRKTVTKEMSVSGGLRRCMNQKRDCIHLSGKA